MKRGPAKQFEPDEVLGRAVEVFRARGFEAASLSELLRAMGIGKKSLYDTFGNKRSLFLRCLEHYSRHSLDCIRHRLMAVESERVLQEIRDILSEWATANQMKGSKGCLLGTSMADFDISDVEITTILRMYLRSLEDAFASALERARETSQSNLRAEPRETARALICVNQGMALIGRIMNDDAFVKSAHSAVGKTLLR